MSRQAVENLVRYLQAARLSVEVPRQAMNFISQFQTIDFFFGSQVRVRALVLYQTFARIKVNINDIHMVQNCETYCRDSYRVASASKIKLLLNIFCDCDNRVGL